ncbi:hypothetical protein [Hymenobacter radiodurans]|uniref:hypothetical protein n=1 Tax=Hymenobacter radiodurans TaxID=2496028 RepID=UPI001058FDBA|nr:hypothetical protein [Hymenobacter radiodurans]
MQLNFSTNAPHTVPNEVWQLQNYLLNEAETLLGPKGNTIIYQPEFKKVGGPQLINSNTRDGAWAALSPYAAQYWPTTAYELAHETIHLLNPVHGYTNHFEEGIAVLFAERISQHTESPQQDDISAYRKALALIHHIPYDPFEVAKRVRSECGALSKVTPEILTKVFKLDTSVADELCKVCIPT